MSIRLQLSGKNDHLPAASFMVALESFWGIIQDLDSAVSGKRQGTVQWEVTTLKKSSPASIGLIGRPAPRQHDYTGVIQAGLINGVQELSRAPERPAYYSDSALLKMRMLARQTKRMDNILVFADDREATIDRNVLVNVDYLIGGNRRSIGSVVGSLDSITVHSGHEFRVWQEGLRRAVTCRFSTDRLPEVKALLKQRVLVYGLLTRNAKGEPISMAVDYIEPRPNPESLPTIEEMSGFIHDLTDGGSLKDYLEELRNG